jgi:hypothetical protein
MAYHSRLTEYTFEIGDFGFVPCKIKRIIVLLHLLVVHYIVCQQIDLFQSP